MLTASIATKTLATIVALLRGLVDEALLRVSRDGVRVTAVDPAHVAMLDLRIPPSTFEGFQVEDCSIGMDLDKLNDIVKAASAEPVIHLSLPKGGSQMTFKFGNITRRMSLLDASSMAVPEVPKLALTSQVTLPNHQLECILKAADSVSDHLRFTLEKEALTIEANGDTDDVRLQIEAADLTGMATDGKCRSLFSTDYLGSFAKAVGTNPLTLQLGTDMPLLANCQPSGMQLTYLLAPRIDAE
jgi:proliferating cell nuclear antigen